MPPPEPLVATEPEPEKFRVKLLAMEPVAVPESEGNDPVAPSYVLVPPATVPDPLTEPPPEVSAVAGKLKVMFRVPPESTTGSGIDTFELVPIKLVSATVSLTVPFPMPERFAVPVTLTFPVVVESVAVTFTVIVVVVVAACTPAPISNTTAKSRHSLRGI